MTLFRVLYAPTYFLFFVAGAAVAIVNLPGDSSRLAQATPGPAHWRKPFGPRVTSSHVPAGCGYPMTREDDPMNQQNDNGGNRQSQGQRDNQQSQNQSGREQAPGERQQGMQPGSDRDDYGAPGSQSGRVGDKQFEQGEKGRNRAPGEARDEQEGRDAPDSEHARQAEQSENRRDRIEDDPGFGQE